MRNSAAIFKHKMQNIDLLMMFIPGLIFLIVFCYIPMYGLVIAFKNFSISKGIMGSEWAGLKYINMALSDPYFVNAFRNTVWISFLKLIGNFIAPILLALSLNEVRNIQFKKAAQTITYLPYFISWIVLSGIFLQIFALDGVINSIVKTFGGNEIMFMTNGKFFLFMLIITDMWKNIGYGSVIYLAALSGIPPEIYEAARIDGANRFRQTLSVTIPSLLPVMVAMLILSAGNILNAGFDQIFNMYNSQVRGVSEIIDTYVYKKGIAEMNFSYSTAVGLFKSIISLLLIFSANKFCHLIGQKEYSIW